MTIIIQLDYIVINARVGCILQPFSTRHPMSQISGFIQMVELDWKWMNSRLIQVL